MSSVAFPPGPRISLLEGFLLATRRRDPIRFLKRIADKHGDLVHFQVGSRNIFLLNNPDLIKDALTRYYESFAKGRQEGPRKRHFLGDGLLTSEGEVHQAQRRVLQPAFHRQTFMSQEAVILEQGVRFRESWRSGQQVDIMREMKRLTLAITSKSIFHTKTDAEADEINEAVTLVLSQFSPFGSPLGEFLGRLPMSRARRIHKAQQRLDTLIHKVINERRESGEDRGDLLSLLISELTSSGANDHTTNDRLIRDQALTFFLAGFETMGTALAWSWYLLAQNPAAQEQLFGELDSVLNPRLPSLADLPLLPFTKMVFSEAMRLYPPVWIVARYLIKDFESGGYVMPAGSTVIISQYLMHHDARFFPDPGRFDPQRWTPQAKAIRPKFSYFPFGGGPRGCLGEGLSWIQGTLLLATIAQRWRLRAVSNRRVELRARVTLQPKHEIRLQLERRE